MIVVTMLQVEETPDASRFKKYEASPPKSLPNFQHKLLIRADEHVRKLTVT